MDFKSIILSYHPCDEEVIAAVEHHCHMESWAKGELMVRTGTVPKKMFFIKSGVVRVGYSNEGCEDTLLFGIDGDIWIELSAWFGDPDGAVFDQECITDTEAYVLGFDDCRRLMATHRGWMEWMFQTAFGQLWMIQKKYQWFASRSAAARYEAFLQWRPLANVVPVKYVAQYIGVNPSTLSRIRKDITTRGHIPDRGAESGEPAES